MGRNMFRFDCHVNTCDSKGLFVMRPFPPSGARVLGVKAHGVMKPIDHNSICISGQAQAGAGCTCHKFPVKSEPLPNLRTSYELSDAPLQGQENKNHHGFVTCEQMIATNIILKRIQFYTKNYLIRPPHDCHTALCPLPQPRVSAWLVACGEDSWV